MTTVWRDLKTLPPEFMNTQTSITKRSVDLLAKTWMSTFDKFIYRRFPDCYWTARDHGNDTWEGVEQGWLAVAWMPVPEVPAEWPPAPPPQLDRAGLQRERERPMYRDAGPAPGAAEPGTVGHYHAATGAVTLDGVPLTIADVDAGLASLAERAVPRYVSEHAAAIASADATIASAEATIARIDAELPPAVAEARRIAREGIESAAREMGDDGKKTLL